LTGLGITWHEAPGVNDRTRRRTFSEIAANCVRSDILRLCNWARRSRTDYV